jgi:hypothetical protein
MRGPETRLPPLPPLADPEGPAAVPVRALGRLLLALLCVLVGSLGLLSACLKPELLTPHGTPRPVGVEPAGGAQ